MRYYLKEEFLHDNNVKNAGNKARNDVEVIFNRLGYAPLKVRVEDWYKMNVLNAQIHKYRALLRAFKRLKKNDAIVIQFPLLHHSLFINSLLKSLKNRGVNIYLLIHDLETLRFVNDKTLPFRMRLRMKLMESDTFHSVTGIIAHNPIMKSVLVDKGVEADKIVSLGIFDYLIPNIVAGNLAQEKAGYLYSLPEEPAYNLYGVGFDESRALANETYFGSFLPDELPAALEGGFGLVWDGDSAETCSGVFGEYLRYNNSHKASLYLAAGFPVVVWEESALAHFVIDKQCGLVVSSLSDLKENLDTLSEEQYKEMLENAKQIGSKLRQGQYLRTALSKLK